MVKESKIIIKQIPNPDNPELGIKYVGAKEYATVKVGRDGKNITGIDEFALDITSLPAEESKKKAAEVKKLRESLEKLLGVELHPTSEYWDKFILILEDEITLTPETNPLDRLHERVLIANAYVAPSYEAINEDEKYANCLFYMYKEEEEIALSASKQQKKDKATSKLFILSEENPLKLKAIAAYIFGFDMDDSITDGEIYIKVKEFLEAKDERAQKNNIEAFLQACGKETEELATKQVFDKALKKRLVTSKGNVYRRGDEVYGNNYEEALEYLLSPEHSGELSSLKKQVAGK